MKVIIAALVSICFWNSVVQAQSPAIDSIKTKINQANSTEERADLYHQLAEKLFSFNYEAAYEAAEQSLQLAKNGGYAKGKAQALTAIGNYYMYKGLNRKAFQSFNDAISAVNGIKVDDYPALPYIRLSILYRIQGKYDSTRMYLAKAERLLPNETSPLRGSLYASMGQLAKEESRKLDALQLLNRSLAIRAKANPLSLADTWRMIGSVYTDLSMYDSADLCFDRVDNLLKRANDPEVAMLLSLDRGETSFERGDMTSAINYYNDALSKLKVNNYRRHYAYILMKIGELYESQGAYNTAYEYLFNALKEFEALNARPNMARSYSQIGWCYNYQENYALAEEYGQKALNLGLQIGDSSSIAQNKNLIGYAQLKTHRYYDALNNFKQSLAIRQKIQHWWGVTYTLHNLALTYAALGDRDKAFSLLKQALELNGRIKNKSGIVFTKNELGLQYTKVRDFKNAMSHLDEANRIAKEIPLPAQLVVNYKHYINLFETRGDKEKTIHYFKLYTNLQDSLSNEYSSGRMARADALFQLQQKANEILVINREKEIQEERLKSQEAQIDFQRKVLTIVIISLLILAVFLFIIFRLLRARTRAEKMLLKKNKEISEQKEEIAAQSEELTEANNKLIKLNADLQQMNEDIAAQSEELHDANINLELRVKERTQQLHKSYEELETFFYRTSHDFRRPLTNYLGLAQIAKTEVRDKQALQLFEMVRETTIALDNMLIKLQSISGGSQEKSAQPFSACEVISECAKNQSESIQQKQIRLIQQCDDMVLKSNRHFFKSIVENLLENAIHFSSPIDPFIKISFSVNQSHAHLTIQDNGQGIPSTIQNRIFEMYYRGSDKSKGNGLGLYITKRAVEKLEGTISFVSKLNEGTTFTVMFPVEVQDL